MFHPLVTLADVHMKTRFGGRQRPHLAITSWLRGSGEAVEPIGTTAVQSPQLAPATPPAAPAAAEPPAPKPATPAATLAAPGLQPVAEVTLQEEVGDIIPF